MGTQLARINRLRALGFKRSEIRTVTGATLEEIDRALRKYHYDEAEDLERTAIRMLRKVPAWWTGDAESYRRSVRGNFCDVL